MNDLTQGSISRHIVSLAVPIAIGMAFQMLYHLVDLFFVARLGDAAIAGVSAAGNLQFLLMAMTQVLGIGTMALISHAMGRKAPDDGNRIYNQGLLLAVVGTGVTLGLGYLLADTYLRTLADDAQTIEAGRTYLLWFLPALALQFPLVAMSSALRGCGITRPTMIAQTLSVLLNAVLAPILISGWITGYPMGVAGAGLASTLSVMVGIALMTWFFRRAKTPLGARRELLRPDWPTLGSILRIGLPPGGEFALMFAYMAVIYIVIAPFGADAQAGFGIGSRLMQVLFLPALALSFAAAPIAGQNMGAGHDDRVRQTFRVAATLCTGFMVLITVLCQLASPALVGLFTADPKVVAYGAEFLQVVSWNFVMSGLVFTASGMFQALGNTIPAVMSTATRIPTFMVPAFVLAARPGFALGELWQLSVASVAFQAVVSLVLLRREFGHRLDPFPGHPDQPPSGEIGAPSAASSTVTGRPGALT